MEHRAWKVTGHAGPVLDVKWAPHNDNLVASASEDCRVRVWFVPDGGLTQDLTESLVSSRDGLLVCVTAVVQVTLTGHRRRVGLLEWHPTAENVLASAGYDHLLIVWDAGRGVPLNIIECHTDTIFSMSFNRSVARTTCCPGSRAQYALSQWCPSWSQEITKPKIFVGLQAGLAAGHHL